MKKIHFLFLLLFGSAILSAQNQDYYPPTAVPDRIILNLTETPFNSMAVTWRTAIYINKGYVQITEAGPSPDLEETARVIPTQKMPYLSDQNGANYYSAIIDGLSPETQYVYRVGDSTHWSEWSHFWTAASGEKPLSFIYFGDAQNDLKSMWSRTIRNAYREMPKADFLLHAGDLVNSRNRDHEWGEWFYAGGWINRMMPSVATPGNHEYGDDENGVYTLSKNWKPSFTLPENGPEGLGETAYYVDYQNTRVISIDAPAFTHYAEDSSSQVNWLEGILARNPNKWTIVTMHYPIYSTKYGRDNEELRDGLQPLFEKYRVDLVLQGHDHTYGRGTNLPIGKDEKGSLDGPMYVVSVSGPKMYDLGMGDWMQRGAANTQLYQLIRIDGDVLTYDAYTVDNKIYDSFELRKGPSGRNIFNDFAPAKVQERLDLPPRYLESFTPEELEEFQARKAEYEARKQGDN